jgi:cellulose synthase operon protein C
MKMRSPAIGSLSRQRALRRVGAALALTLIAVALCAVWRGSQALARRRVFRDLTSTPRRPLEARLSDPRVDRHRPTSVVRGGRPQGDRKEVRLGDLVLLERAGDDQGVAEILLLSGEVSQARLRFEQLRKARHDPAPLLNDEAAAALALGDPEAALPLLDRALAQEPLSPQAQFNRALALRALELPLTAARHFDRVAQLKEPGWSEEAAAEAQRLRASCAERVAVAERSRALVTALALEGRLPPPGDGLPDDLRLGLYQAVRSAPGRSAVLALLPLAQRLDRHYGGGALEAYVRRVADADFGRRGPAARRYAALLRASATDRPAAVDALLRSPADPALADIMLGALADPSTGGAQSWTEETRARARRSLPLVHRLVADLSDPWFEVYEQQLRSESENHRRRYGESLLAAQQGLERCRGLGVSLLCSNLQFREVSALNGLYRLTEATRHLRLAREEARRQGWVEQEARLLRVAGELEDGRMRGPLSRAYLEELLLHPRARCADRRYAAEALATQDLAANRLWDAAGHLGQVPSCWREYGALTTEGLFVAAALHRVGNIGLDEMKVNDSLTLMKINGPREGHFLYLAAHGLWLLPTAPAAARELLARGLEEARKSEDDAERMVVQSKIHLALALEAARSKNWEAALDRLADAAAVARPSGCVLGLAVDVERTLTVLRETSGRMEGWLEIKTADQLEGRTRSGGAPRLPPSLRSRLATCSEVKVIATAQQRWWTDLEIPGGLPWSYALRPASGAALPGPTDQADSYRLVIADPDPPAALGLPRLAPPSVESGPGTHLLAGREANPMRVLDELPRASFIDFRVHGVADAEISEHTALVLSADAEGRYLLTPNELRTINLPRRPVVILAACQSASRPTNHPDPSELAGGFVRAGARAVYATTTPVPDAEADAFFGRIRTALSAGRSPAAALRDARASWPNSSNSWVSGVLAFE